MGAYKHNVVVVGVYIHGVLILCGCLLARFYGKWTRVHCVSLAMIKLNKNEANSLNWAALSPISLRCY